VYAGVSAIYLDEMATLWANGGGSKARAQYQELDVRLCGLMTEMELFTPKCPLIRAPFFFYRLFGSSMRNLFRALSGWHSASARRGRI
jgi:hypothetical protein